MRKALFAAAAFVAICSAPGWIPAGDNATGRIYTPGEIETLFLGKGKGELVGAAGTPDKLYGVMGEEGVPVNLSAHWVYRVPKTGIVVDPATGKSPKELHVWFDPNDRVERVACDFSP